jgi:hypothetical protein
MIILIAFPLYRNYLTRKNLKNKQMKKTILFLFLVTTLNTFAQTGFTIGAGYSASWLNTSELSDFFTLVNEANPGLTDQFESEKSYRGYNLLAGSRSEKSAFIVTYQQVFSKSTAEGIIPVISPDAGLFEIATRHSSVTMAYDYYLVRNLALGGQFGYTYSTIRNSQYELAFGDSKSVVDKKGGLSAGINAIIEIPLGSSAFFQVQPYYMLAFYDMDMDNVANIYLGQGNTAATTSDLRGFGVDLKVGITIQ